MRNVVRIVIVWASWMATPAPAQQALPLGAVQAPPLQPRTARFVMTPASLGHRVQVDVTAPPVTGPPGEKLPAVYVLDAGYDMTAQMAGFIMAGGEMAPAYVIAIGYPNPNGSHIGERNTDLSHVSAPFLPDGPVYGGGGPAFEAFLLKELRPALESRLPLDPDRAVLFGHSLGGLFAATVLANDPTAFSGYLIASAPLDRDLEILAKVSGAAPKGEGTRVYVSHTPEDVEVFDAGGLAPALSGPGSTFEVKERVFEEEGHRSSFLRLPQDALPFLLPPPPPVAAASRPEAVTVDAAVLARYAGVYQVAPGVTLTVRDERSSLYARATNEAEFELVPMSEREFFYRDPGIQARIRFEVSRDGAAEGLVIVQNGRETPARRLD